MKKITLLLIAILISFSVFAQKGDTNLSGKLPFLKDGDTVVLTVYRYANIQSYLPFQENHLCVAKNHSFAFRLEGQKGPQYIDLTFRLNNIPDLLHYILMPGDNILITQGSGRYIFTGKQAAGFQVQQQLNAIATAINANPIPRQSKSDFQYMPLSFLQNDSITQCQQTFLEQHAGLINRQLLLLLKMNIEYGNIEFKTSTIFTCGYSYLDSLFNPSREAYIQYKNGHATDFDLSSRDTLTMQNSECFSETVLYRYKVDSCLMKGQHFSVHKYYRYVSGKFSGALREQLVTALFVENKRTTQNISGDIDDALGYIRNPEFISVLKNLKATNTEGAPAIDFTVEDINGRKVNLKDFFGKVIILDFWFTGCGACRDLAPILHKIEQKFQNKQVVFISISVDKAKKRWLESVKGDLYTSNLSVNVYTEGMGEAHPSFRHYGTGCPTLILIDKNGKLGPNPNDPRTDNGVGLEKLIARYL